jgi:hypothetical protein
MFTRALMTYNNGLIANIPLVPGDFSGATLNLGVQERIITKINDLGELLFSETEPQQRQGAFTLQYGKCNQEVMALMFGHPLESAAITDAYYHRTFKALATIPAVVAGQHGFEMTADTAAGSASYIDATGKTVPLTRQPFATFTAATPKSYAQGAAGAFKFSNDIVAGRFDVTPFVPYAIADADQLNHTRFGLFQVWLQGVIQYRGVKRVFQIHFSEAELNRQENSQIDPTQTPVNVNFRDLSPACVMNVKWLNRTVVC